MHGLGSVSYIKITTLLQVSSFHCKSSDLYLIQVLFVTVSFILCKCKLIWSYTSPNLYNAVAMWCSIRPSMSTDSVPVGVVILIG